MELGGGGGAAGQVIITVKKLSMHLLILSTNYSMQLPGVVKPFLLSHNKFI